MNNKIYLIVFIFVSLFLLVFFVLGNVYEYNSYIISLNKKIEAIMFNIKEKYPEISDDEIIKNLNSYDSKNNIDNKFFEKYGIDTKKDSILIEHSKNYHKFLVINILFFIISILIILTIFLIYNKRKDKEISKITKYIEQINKKNYSLCIDEISEDELSILKNEIYKTTVMLKESAENSKKDKSELKKSLEDISHQLKTPLTSILIILDNIIDDPNMEKDIRDDFVRDIKREITKITFLVQALLKLAQFDASTVNFVKENVFIKDIVNESIKNVRSLCDLKNVKIEINGNEKSKVQCDFMWQVEAVTNILKNAIEHSKQNTFVTINYENNKAYSSIEIINKGDFIDREDLPHIFERFYKGKNSTNDSIGIGLALSKAIVEKDNGIIIVNSENKCTTFCIKYY